MFQIKNFNSIVASMINNVTGGSDELTDFNTGSVVRTILEAAAAEIDQYYQALLKGFYEAVPVAIYKSFSFSRLPAVGASGYVTFTRESGYVGEITIPTGTRVTIPGESFNYAVVSGVVMEAGVNTVDALVLAAVTGSSTNCLAGSITSITDSIDGIASVTNAAAFTNGSDEETDGERKLRFQKWLNTLARSTRESIEYGASTVKLYDDSGVVTEQVTKVVVYEPCVDDTPIGDPGTVYVYIWNGVDGASSSLIAETSKILHGYVDDDGNKVAGWKAAGVVATVAAVTPTAVNVTATITLDGSRLEADVDADVEAAIGNLFSSLDIGESLIFSKLIQTVMDVEGVADVSFTTPTASTSAGGDYNICAQGTVTLTYV